MRQFKSVDESPKDVIILSASEALSESEFLKFAIERLRSDDFEKSEKANLIDLLERISNDLRPYWVK